MDYWTAVMVTLSLPSLTGIILVLLQYFLKILCGHCSDSGGVLEVESSHGNDIIIVSIYQELIPLYFTFRSHQFTAHLLFSIPATPSPIPSPHSPHCTPT